MVPWHAKAWGVSQLEERQVKRIREHFNCCEELVKSVDLRLLIFNGKLWEQLFVNNPRGPMLGREFKKIDTGTFTYKSITGKKHGGEIILGRVELNGRWIPALIFSWFIHTARPPCRAEELAKLGCEAYRRFSGAGLRVNLP
jgi:hypothetical protein